MKGIESIQALLEKYYQGKSSLEEESYLKEFMLNNEVPAPMKADQEFFRNIRGLDHPDYLNEKRIEGKLDFLISEKDRRVKSRRNVFLAVSALAASFLILFGIYLKFTPGPSVEPGMTQHLQDTYEYPVMAYTGTKEALLFVSGKLNKGTEELENIGYFQKGIEKLQTFSTFDTGIDKLKHLSKFDQLGN